MEKTAKKVKIRQSLVENPAYDFEYKPNPPQNPEGEFMSSEQANEQYKIEGGQLENFVTKAYVLDGDVYIKNNDEAEQMIAKAQKDDYSTLIIITGNLIHEGFVCGNLTPLMVCGDLKCDAIGTNERDITIKGNIYAKHTFFHAGSDCCFACFGDIFTPYFLTNNDDATLNIRFPKQAIAINYEPEMYESDLDFECDYDAKHFAKVMEYEVLDSGFELDVRRFLDHVASGKNPIREYERTSNEIKADKKRKESEIVSDKIQEADNTLDLSCLNLKIFPEDVCQLTELKRLDISGNDIKKLPKAIKNLTNLTHLNVSHNNDINIEAVCELANLEVLNIQYVAYNDFKLPDDLGRLKNLKTLLADVGGSTIINPQVIGELENLENLAIKADCVCKEAPNYTPGIKAIKHLKRLRIAGYLPEDYKTQLEKEYGHLEVTFGR